MGQTAKQAIPNWVPGDEAASKLFESARGLASLSSKRGHSLVVWSGNCLIFLAAAYLALPEGSPASAMFSTTTDWKSISGFDLFASIGLGWCVCRVIERGFDLAKARGALVSALSILSVPAAQIMESAKRIEDGEPGEATLCALRELVKIQGGGLDVDGEDDE